MATQFNLVPVEGMGLAPIPLSSEQSTIIGRMNATKFGVPAKLLTFISRQHVQLDVRDGNTVFVTALASMQDQNHLIRIGEHILRKGVRSSLRIGDRLTLLNGATGSEESTTPAGELTYFLETQAHIGLNKTAELNVDVVVMVQPPAQPRAPPAPEQAGKKRPRAPSPAPGPSVAPVRPKAPPPAEADDNEEKADRGAGDDEDDDEAAATVECAICSELIVGAWACGCGAGCTFCKLCIVPWVAKAGSCPSCSEAVTGEKGHRNVMVDQFVALLVKRRQVKAEDAAVYLERKGILGDAKPPPRVAPDAVAGPQTRGPGDVLVIDSDEEEEEVEEVIDLC